MAALPVSHSTAPFTSHQPIILEFAFGPLSALLLHGPTLLSRSLCFHTSPPCTSATLSGLATGWSSYLPPCHADCYHPPCVHPHVSSIMHLAHYTHCVARHVSPVIFHAHCTYRASHYVSPITCHVHRSHSVTHHMSCPLCSCVNPPCVTHHMCCARKSLHHHHV